MVIVFALVGLIAGILVGLFNATGTRQEAGAGVTERSDESTTTETTELPDRFYTVVLASVPRSRERSDAEARAEAFRAEGVQDVGVLDPTRYSSLADNFWAVSSGVFETQQEAADHRDELRSRFPDLANAYLKLVRNEG
jgi:SPOR domain